jgi:hypothetical protein
MKLIAATTDISSKDLPLRDDVRLLGRILGETLRDQEGEASYQLIENVRRAAVRFRKLASTWVIKQCGAYRGPATSQISWKKNSRKRRKVLFSSLVC